MAPVNLLSLPTDLLISLPGYLHNIEDYMNLSSACRTLRDSMATANPNAVLRLAAAQSNIFFRPSPLFLVAATARELGYWARICDQNENELVKKVEAGIDALMELVLEHCGLTMARIRELHLLRFSTLNPVENIVDQCIGKPWYEIVDKCIGRPSWDEVPDFQVNADANTIEAWPTDILFHLIIYGELFAPDLDAVLDQNMQKRRLKLTTRLELLKHCVPDRSTGRWEPGRDPRRVAVKDTGPYKQGPGGPWPETFRNDHMRALMWLISSSPAWGRLWKAIREKAGPDFQADFQDSWVDDHSDHIDQDWRQRLWENVMLCQGFESLQLLQEGSALDSWISKIREWRDKSSRLEREPAMIWMGSSEKFTLEYPWLLGDLKVLLLPEYQTI